MEICITFYHGNLPNMQICIIFLSHHFMVFRHCTFFWCPRSWSVLYSCFLFIYIFCIKEHTTCLYVFYKVWPWVLHPYGIKPTTLESYPLALSIQYTVYHNVYSREAVRSLFNDKKWFLILYVLLLMF